MLLSFIRKEFYHILRDRKTLLMLIGMPVAQILLFGFALTNEVKDTPTVIVSEGRDAVVRTLGERFAHSRQFAVKDYLATTEEVGAAFRANKAKLAVVLPQGIERRLMRGEHVQIALITDASNPNEASTLVSYASAVIASYLKEVVPPVNQAQVELVSGGKSIGVLTTLLYNPELKESYNFVPGVLSLILMLICVLMTSVSIVREKEMGTMEVLLVSPVRPLTLILAKAAPYLLISVVNFLVILLISVTLLDMPVRGSVGLLFFESVLLIFVALSLGLLISNSTESQQTAMLLSLMGMMIPTLLFTGFMFPIENMPVALQYISNIVPTRWYYVIVKSIMLKGLGFGAIWKETLILAAMAVVLVGVSVVKFKKRLE